MAAFDTYSLEAENEDEDLTFAEGEVEVEEGFLDEQPEEAAEGFDEDGGYLAIGARTSRSPAPAEGSVAPRSLHLHLA